MDGFLVRSDGGVCVSDVKEVELGNALVVGVVTVLLSNSVSSGEGVGISLEDEFIFASGAADILVLLQMGRV